ncbi:MAG: sulfatase [Planctomycetaceae bacterium]|nr:sulfatase [Planctomycetaceae bacterium]
MQKKGQTVNARLTNRRQAILTWLVSLVASTVSAAERPNVVFVFADDWGRYASIYAQHEPGGISDLVQTPNFDRVAREGVLFTNAFVNAPSCTPCRSSLMSGQYFWRTGRGAILQGAIWDSSIPSWPLLLRSSGYHIGHTAKVWSPGSPANAPFGAQETAYNKRGGRFNGFSQNVEKADTVEGGKAALLNEVRGNFQDFLAARPDDAPFCYWWGPTNTHRTWIQGSGKKFWGLNPDQLEGKLPDSLPDVPIVREDVADYLGEVQAFDAGLGVILEELERTGEADKTLLIISGDHGIPGFPYGKCNLYDLGTHVSLAVRWPGKAPGNRVVSDFVCLPDLAPTILDACHVAVPDVMTGRSIQSVLLSDRQGQVEESRDAVIVGRERHVAAARTDFLPYPQRAIRTTDFLYIRNFEADRWPMGTAPGFGLPSTGMPTWQQLNASTFAAFADMDASPTKAWIATNCLDNPMLRKYFDYAFAQRPTEELYDLRKDRDQIHNVAGLAIYADVQASLSKRLMSVLETTGDPRVTGDGKTFDRRPFSAPNDPAPQQQKQQQQRRQQQGRENSKQ